jgi:hypothetical protein
MGKASRKKKLRRLSPQANYTDRATAAVGEVVPTFKRREISVKIAGIPAGILTEHRPNTSLECFHYAGACSLEQ